MIELPDPQLIREFHYEQKHFRGDELIALYQNIQKYGTILQFSEPHRFDGVKAIEIGPNELFAIKRSGPPNRFFPCVLRTVIINNFTVIIDE